MQFAAAINRHDMHALTALMTPDIVLEFFWHPWQRLECRLVVRPDRRELRERSDGGLQRRYGKQDRDLKSQGLISQGRIDHRIRCRHLTSSTPRIVNAKLAP
jgi:hypothetical protein